MRGILYEVNGENFGDMVAEILKSCGQQKNIVRLVFFGNARNNVMYLEQREEISRQVCAFFGDACPTFSYVAQKPLCADLAVEVHTVDASFKGEIIYKVGTELLRQKDLRYIVLEGEGYRELVVSGLCGDSLTDTLKFQAEEAMMLMLELLAYEGFRVQDVVRQWNYLECITGYDDGIQRYQEFNEVRGCSYATVVWENGYPAATGIGTQAGGVLLDFSAIQTDDAKWRCSGVNNMLQVAAHAYSQRVVEGITPKFERARVISNDKEGIVFISGTAAIRGEQSFKYMGAADQMRITMENIDFLISKENLEQFGFRRKGVLQMIRVYLKYAEDLKEVQEYVHRNFGTLPVLYLLADVCREELLVEVEGIALLD